MKTARQAINSALTEMQTQPLPEKPIDLEAWAKWLEIETFNDPQVEELVATCARFVRAIRGRQRPSWLSLLGTSGAGKTHCAKRIWNHFEQKIDHSRCNYVPQFIFWPRYIEQMREDACRGAGNGQFLDIPNWPLLVLDDIGAGQDKTGFASDKLNTLLSCRVGKWTVLTSNLSLEQLAQIDTRIASRINREPGNLVIDLSVDDYGLRALDKASGGPA